MQYKAEVEYAINMEYMYKCTRKHMSSTRMQRDELFFSFWTHYVASFFTALTE